MKARPYQHELEQNLYDLWDEHRVIAGILPTGGGKTFIFSQITEQHIGAAIAIAHRQELVSQISISLARHGVYHRVIAPKAVQRFIISQHVNELGANYVRPHAAVGVAGVDTLLSRSQEHRSWLDTVTLWIMDECHHILRDNKWGKAAALFPRARGLGVTATLHRADGKGLGAHHDGLIEAYCEGPTPRELIDMGYLCDYKIFAPPSDLDLTGVNVTASGDYNQKRLKAAVQRSHIVGDVVDQYKRHADGKLGITFATDVETAGVIAEQFNAAGVPAMALSGNTNDVVRAEAIRRFSRGELMQLVNVDLFGEGFDVPGVEVVCKARPTQSFSLDRQQSGRALRTAEGKTHALIIDHVSNYKRHGLPDSLRAWSLDRRDKKSRGPSDVVPTRACPLCTGVYERVHSACPYCGHAPQPQARTGPEYVDGDLYELDLATLDAMRGERDRIDGPANVPQHLDSVAQAGVKNKHRRRQDAQAELRESIAWWGGYQRSLGRGDSESYKRFYFEFGVDVLSAQVLGAREARELGDRVNNYLQEKGVVYAHNQD